MRPGAVVFVAVCCLCAAAMVAIATGNAGPDPAKWLLHRSGFWALALLVATLAVSPVARRFHKQGWVAWRRPLGLAAFALASLHVVVYATVYQGFAWAPVIEDVRKRPYILLGLLAWSMLVPMAVTSTRSARRKLGNAWSRLHRAIYLIVPLTILHQGMAQKADFLQTLVFFALTMGLLLERALHARR